MSFQSVEWGATAQMSGIDELNLEMRDNKQAVWGTVSFSSDAKSDPAKFICLSEKKDDETLTKVLDVLLKSWNLKKAAALLSITGSAQDWALEPHLEKVAAPPIACRVAAC